MLVLVEQSLNGLQFGLLLFLLAAGLTLVFGIMDFVNLAHGSLYMMGAYFAATFVAWTNSFVLGIVLALGATLLLGIALEFIAIADGSITLVGAEEHPPYKRPPLTKGLWKGAGEDKIWCGTEERGVDLRLGRRIVMLDLDARRATDDAGEEYAYEKMLLATGGTPRRLDGDGDAVVYYRTLSDYHAVRELADGGASFVETVK